MEVFTLLDNLEDLIENSKKVPLSNKIMVEQKEVLNLIKDIRNKLPEELKVAKFVRQERERILAEAKKEANDIVKEAENRIIAMIDEHEITKKAYEQKDAADIQKIIDKLIDVQKIIPPAGIFMDENSKAIGELRSFQKKNESLTQDSGLSL